PPSDRPPYEGLGRVLISPALHEDIDDEAVLVHRPPQPMPSAVDLQRYFVQVQLVARPTATPAQLLCEHRTEPAHPLADRLVRHRHAPVRQELLHVPQAERKPQVQPDRVADDLWWETVAAVQRGSGDGCRHLARLPDTQPDNAPLGASPP